jgi:hypothetical protein
MSCQRAVAAGNKELIDLCWKSLGLNCRQHPSAAAEAEWKGLVDFLDLNLGEAKFLTPGKHGVLDGALAQVVEDLVADRTSWMEAASRPRWL